MTDIDKIMALADAFAIAVCNRSEARSGLATRLASMDEDAARAALLAAVTEALAQAIRDTREECAKVCADCETEWWKQYKSPGPLQCDTRAEGMSDGAAYLAAAIRELGEPT